MGKSRYFKKHGLTAAHQIYHMAAEFPGFKVVKSRGAVEWVGDVTPTDLSDTYTVKIRYEAPLRPEVTVLSPTLRLANGKTHLPHVFPPDWRRLCLYIDKEWSAERPVTWIVPWIALWLYFYEVWLVTGEWFGEGHEPAEKSIEDVPDTEY